MMYQRKAEVVEAIRAHGIQGVPDGAWLVNTQDGKTNVWTESEFLTHFEAIQAALPTINTATRIAKTRETLTVPKAFAMTPTSEKVLKVIGQTPMSTGDIARVSRLNKSSVSRELGRLTKADLVEKHGAGMYSLGRVNR